MAGIRSEQGFKVQLGALCQNHGSLNGVLQFTDIALPIEGRETIGLCFCQSRRRPIHLFRNQPDEIGRQQRDILPTLAKRRKTLSR